MSFIYRLLGYSCLDVIKEENSKKAIYKRRIIVPEFLVKTDKKKLDMGIKTKGV